VLVVWEQIYHKEHKVKSTQTKGKIKRKRKKSERNKFWAAEEVKTTWNTEMQSFRTNHDYKQRNKNKRRRTTHDYRGNRFIAIHENES
jgi:hypothetical protein